MAKQTTVLEAKIDAKGVKFGAAAIQRELSGVGKAAKGLKDSLFSVKGAIASIGSAVAISSIKDSVVQFERMEASLKSVLQSGEAAAGAMQFIKRTAIDLGQPIDTVAAGFTKLAALGLDPSREALESYGNTAAALGKTLNDMVEAVADATTFEFERLKEFGIKSSQEADKVKFTFQGVTTEVGKSAAEIEDYLQGIGNVQFAGALTEQTATLGGQLDIASSALSIMVTEVSEATGFTALMKDTVSGATEAFIEITNGVDDFIESLKTLKPLTDTMGQSFDIVSGEVSDIAGDIGNAASAVVDFFKKATKGKEDFKRLTQGERMQRRQLGLPPKLGVSAEDQQLTFEQLNEGPQIPAEGLDAARNKKTRFESAFDKAMEQLRKQREEARALREEQERIAEAKAQQAKLEKEAGAIIRANRTNQQVLEDRLIKANELRNAGLLERIEYEREVTAAQDEYRDGLNDVIDAEKERLELQQELQDSIVDTFTDGIKAGKDFKDILGDIAAEMVNMILKGEDLGGIFGGGTPGINPAASGGGGGGLLNTAISAAGSFFGDIGSGIASIFGFADGGRPPTDRPSIVGERGPELFIPDGAGVVVPNGGFGGDTINVYYSPQVNALDPRTAADVIAQNAPTVVGIVQQSFNQQGLRGIRR